MRDTRWHNSARGQRPQLHPAAYAFRKHWKSLAFRTGVAVEPRAGTLLHLTVREFDLTGYLLLDNVIDANIARLRKKVDEPFGKPLIHTVRGIGFCLREGDA